MTTQTYDIQNICFQINRRALLNVPPPRINIVSPYPEYSQFQLDMRRKAEILKYSANATNTKTNNFTKSEKFAMMAKGTSLFSQQNLLDISNGLISCNVNKIVPMPTSSSGVPGPVIDLFLDPSIPLYYYTTNTRSYAIINSVDDSIWTTYTSNDLSFLQSVITELFTLYIHNNITKNTYNFIFETPVSISIKGGAYLLDNLDPIPSNVPIDVNIEAVFIYVYYNDTLIMSNDSNSFSTTGKNIPIVSYDFIPLSLMVNNTKRDFSSVFFTGNLQVSNLSLFVQPGYIYDIKLKFLLNTSKNNFTNIETLAICNVGSYNNNTINCSLLTSPSTDVNSGFVISTK
jgi:hypothetical protein